LSKIHCDAALYNASSPTPMHPPLHHEPLAPPRGRPGFTHRGLVQLPCSQPARVHTGCGTTPPLCTLYPSHLAFWSINAALQDSQNSGDILRTPTSICMHLCMHLSLQKGTWDADQATPHADLHTYRHQAIIVHVSLANASASPNWAKDTPTCSERMLARCDGHRWAADNVTTEQT
jgi:hypothetical protein